MSKKLNLTLSVWRQPGPEAAGGFVTYPASGIPDDASFLEMLDIVNERLIEQGELPIEFPHDCREGICGTCGVMINGRAHGQEKGTATCQLHMRKFNDGDTIVIEPWRAAAFPVVRDLVVDRSPLDKIVEAGGYITAPTGTASDANDTPDPQGSGRLGHGRRGLHRLRRLCGGLPQLGGPALHLGQGVAPQLAAPGSGRALPPDAGHGRDDGGVLRLLHQPR